MHNNSIIIVETYHDMTIERMTLHPVIRQNGLPTMPFIPARMNRLAGTGSAFMNRSWRRYELFSANIAGARSPAGVQKSEKQR